MNIMDAIVFPFWVLANVSIFWASWTLSKFCFTDEDVYQCIVSSIIFSWYLVGIVFIFLGACGILNGIFLTSLILIISIFLLIALHSKSEPIRLQEKAHLYIFCEYNIYIILVMTVLVSRSICDGLRTFPGEWDTLMYHLSRIDQWNQTSSLFTLDSYNWSHPGNNELIGFWLVSPFSGDFLIPLNNLPAVFLLGFASLVLGRSLNLSRSLAHLTSLGIISPVIVHFQLLNCKNDIAVTALFVTSITYSFNIKPNSSLSKHVRLGLSLGLLSGAKYNAIGYSLIVIIITLAKIYSRVNFRSLFRMVAIWIASALPLGAFWYIRNLIVTGNPLYPMGWPNSSNTMLAVYPDIYHSTLWGSMDFNTILYISDAAWSFAGPAHLLAFYAAPITIYWMLFSKESNQRNPNFRNSSTHRSLIFGVLGTGFLLAFTPFVAEDSPGTLNHLRSGYTPMRFGLSFFTLLIINFSAMIQNLSDTNLRLIRLIRFNQYVSPSRFCLDRLRFPILTIAFPLSRLVFMIWGAMLCFQWIQNFILNDEHATYKISILILTLYLVYSLCIIRFTKLNILRIFYIFLFMITFIFSPIAFFHLSSAWHKDFVRHYDSKTGTKILHFISEISPRPKRICVLYYRAYPFHGSTRDFRVFQPFYLPSRQSFLNYLDENRIDTLVVSKDHPLYDGWGNYEQIMYAEDRHLPGWTVEYEDDVFDLHIRSKPVKNPSIQSVRPPATSN